MLNIHVFLLGILFRHKAFLSPDLVSPQQLETFDIHPGELEMPLPLKKELKDVYIFRRAVRAVTGYQISKTEPITYGMMAGWIRRIGELLGFECTTIPYSLRYNAANELDQNRACSYPLLTMLIC